VRWYSKHDSNSGLSFENTQPGCRRAGVASGEVIVLESS
jgi:hypothetical protein